MHDEELSQESKDVLARLSNQENIIKYKKLDFRIDKDLKFEFSENRPLKELFKAIDYRNLSIDKAGRIKDGYEAILIALERYRPRNSDYVKARKKLLINAKKFYDRTEMIFNAFKDKIFPLYAEDGYFEDGERFCTPKDLTPKSEFFILELKKCLKT